MNGLDLLQLERLSNDLYSSTSAKVRFNKARQDASESLQAFLESPSNLTLIFDILSTSRNSQLLYLSLASITRLVPNEWFRLNLNEKKVMHSTLWSLLTSSTDSNYLTSGVCKALARVSRLGFSEFEEAKKVVSNVEVLLQENPSFLEVGLKFFFEMIHEINEPIKARIGSAGKKTAQLFREEPLGRIFLFVVNFLNSSLQKISKEQIFSSLSVMNAALGFDFMGIQADDTGEDTSCLQIPLSWKELFEKPIFFEFLQFLIIHSDEEVELLACRALNHVGAVRKSIFASSVDLRKVYIKRFLSASQQIMQSKQLQTISLQEFIQGLKRFLCNFGLKEISETEDLIPWLEVLANYSLETFKRPSSLTSSIESTLIVWNSIIFDCNLQLTESSTPLNSYAKGLFSTFLTRSLDLVTQEVFESSKEQEVRENLEQLANISLCFYPEMIRNFEETFLAIERNSREKVSLRMAWLVLIASALISLKDGKNDEVDLMSDVTITRLVFESLSKMQGGFSYVTQAYLSFMLGLSKVYINCANEKFWVLLDNTQDSLDTTLDSCLNLILDYCFQVMSNDEERIVSKALEVLELLAKGYYSNKYMMKNERVQTLMTRYLSFPLCVSFPKHRSRLFFILVQLWLNEDLSTPIEVFLTPLQDNLNQLAKTGEASQFVLTFKELEGITSGLTNSKNFLEFFEWIFYKFQVVMSACSFHLYNPSVMHALLSFLHEITQNRNSRIRFDISSNYGIVFFKNISAVVIGYGKIVLENRESSDYFKQFYSSIKRILGICNNLFNGGYVPFGVFDVFQDGSYHETLSLYFSMLDSMAISEMSSYQKLLDIIYEFIETLCKSHLKTLFTVLDISCFVKVLFYLIQGIRITNMKHCSSTSASISLLCEYIIKVNQKDFPERALVQSRLNQSEYLLLELFRNVVEVIVLEDSNYMWSLSKPLLGLMIINEQHFEEVKNAVLAKVNCSADLYEKLFKAIQDLMNGVSRTLDTKNRDRFGKNFATLRQVLGLVYA